MDTSGLEKSLSDFNPFIRQQVIADISRQVNAGSIEVEAEKMAFNLHCHTFFSFNAYGYSPSGLAWLAKKKGFKALGIVDFDTLDGVSEFLDSCETLGVRGSAGIETRVFIPEFSTREINSPGEPGVCYHMGLGFTSTTVPPAAVAMLNKLRQRANQRNREMISRINQYLEPVNLDYDLDVLPLTPAGNATERHMLTAYIRLVEKQVPDAVKFWSKALGQTPEQIQGIIQDPAKISNLIRSKLMKRGGVGYTQPGPSTFPGIEEFHSLITACGALPCFAWLDGTSSGEKDIKELLDLVVSRGVVITNVIPDRNWNISDPEQRRLKVQNLVDFVHLAQEMDLPVNVGTEMNSPGNKLVDDFDVPEMLPLYPVFLDGAYFIYGHTLMQRHLGCGYQSVWAKSYFPGRHERNAFYTRVGRLTPPGKIGVEFFTKIDHNYSPEDIVSKLEKIK
jgi:hypothetical protein